MTPCSVSSGSARRRISRCFQRRSFRQSIHPATTPFARPHQQSHDQVRGSSRVECTPRGQSSISNVFKFCSTAGGAEYANISSGEPISVLSHYCAAFSRLSCCHLVWRGRLGGNMKSDRVVRTSTANPLSSSNSVCPMWQNRERLLSTRGRARLGPVPRRGRPVPAPGRRGW
jgi:hypothetical protein